MVLLLPLEKANTTPYAIRMIYNYDIDKSLVPNWHEGFVIFLRFV